MRARCLLLLSVAAAFTFAGAADALADSTVSSNWAGYAVHRSGVHFRRVSAQWRQPSATCIPGRSAYSAAWVGLGGYSTTSTALEQIGTETDCTASGNVLSSSWYELVPAPSRNVSLGVRPGDVMSAVVTVVGHRATLTLKDLTRNRSFTKTQTISSVDVSSAEWIVEAPSDCISVNSCQTLPLANFGTTSFSGASAQTTTGKAGSITNPAWTATKITLTPGGRRFVSNGGGASAGGAVPSKPSATGTGFDVTYALLPVQNPVFAPRAGVLRTGYIEHPGR